MYESSASPNSNNMDTPLCRPKHLIRKRSPLGASSTPIVVEERLQRFKQEFNRCLAEKRMEILELRGQLASKNNEIQQLKMDENTALVERNTNKELAERLANKLKLAESELAKLRRNSLSGSKMVNGSIHSEGTLRENCRCVELKKSLDELQTQKEELAQNYQELTDRNKSLNELLSKRSDRVNGNESAKEHTKSPPLKDSQDECYQLKNLYMNLSSEKDDLVRELAQLKALDVNKELSEQKNKVVLLEKALSTTEAKCDELSKLMELEKEHLTQRIEELQAKYGKIKKPMNRFTKDKF